MTDRDKLRLPPGYRLDRSDPDLWTLRRLEGWVVAWEDHEVAGEE
jgi:phosphodiesterase/alkaline phosphatase D-like protein